MGRYAVIENNQVINIIEAAGPEALPGVVLMEAPDWTAIGDLLVDGRLPAAPEPEPVEFNPGPDYVRRDGDWWKIRFTKKEFLLLCGLPQVIALEAAIGGGNARAKAVHTLLMAAEYIDVTDPDTGLMVQLLTTEAGGSVLTAGQAAELLKGVRYEDAA